MDRHRSDQTVRHSTGARQETAVPPLVDRRPDGVIYHPSILYFALFGAIVGGTLFGILGWAISDGPWPIAGMGQFSASGTEVAVFTAAGVGVAVGGLAGALIALFRLPRRYARTHEDA